MGVVSVRFIISGFVFQVLDRHREVIDQSHVVICHGVRE
jgi:hypothetical protein